MIIEVGKKYEYIGISGGVYELVFIGKYDVVLKLALETLYTLSIDTFKKEYKEYVEPRKTKKVLVADYFNSERGSIYSWNVRTFSSESTPHAQWKKVIGSERTIEIEE